MKVSVNVVTKNRAELLSCALDSILSQDYHDLEIVVVDDGSTDLTPKVIESYKNRIDLIAFRFENSAGVVKARQKALELSTGELVAILDDDDVWVDSRKISLQVNRFIKNSRLVLVGCYGEIKDVLSQKSYCWMPPVDDRSIRSQMLLRNSFMHPAMMFKRSAAVEAGGYAHDIQYAEDYALVLKLGLLGGLEVVPQVLMRFRLNHDGLTSRNNIKQIKSGIGLIYKYRNDYPNFFPAIIKWSTHYLFVLFLGSRLWFSMTRWKNSKMVYEK